MEQKPRYFAFALTDRCQSHCSTCNGWQTPVKNKIYELSSNDWKFILLSLHEWLGNFDFIFTGGEPFLRNEIFELADYAKSLGLIPKVITNGLALRNKCEKLIDSGFQDITISLNSVKNPKIHNDSRGLPNAFKITSDVIQNLCYLNRKKKAGKTILIASVIMPSNLTEMVPLAKFAHQNGIGINFQLLDSGESFFMAHEIQYEDLFLKMKNQTIQAIDELIRLKKQGYLIYNTENQLIAFKDLILNSKVETGTKQLTQEENKNINRDIYLEEEIKYQIEDKINPEIINKISCNKKSINRDICEKDASCKIGYHNFLIDPYGNVRVCFNFEPIGSLITEKAENIWNGKAAEKIRRKIAKCEKSCKLLNCNYHEGD